MQAIHAELVAFDVGGPVGAFVGACAKQYDDFAALSRFFEDKTRGRVDFQPLRTPAKDAVWRRVASAEKVEPESVLEFWLGLVDDERHIMLDAGLRDFFQNALVVSDDFGVFHHCVVAHNENFAAMALLFRDVADKCRPYQLQEHGTVFAAAKADDPWTTAVVKQELVGDFGFDMLYVEVHTSIVVEK